jgi:hypothetical protein
LNGDIFQGIQSRVNSVKDAATTVPSGAVATPIQYIQSKVNSIKDAIASSLPDAIAASIQEIEKYIPKNCSLGTKDFCVGTGHNTTCKNLPLSLSDLVPDIAQDLSDVVQILPDTLEKPLRVLFIRSSTYIIVSSFTLSRAMTLT